MQDSDLTWQRRRHSPASGLLRKGCAPKRRGATRDLRIGDAGCTVGAQAKGRLRTRSARAAPWAAIITHPIVRLQGAAHAEGVGRRGAVSASIIKTFLPSGRRGAAGRLRTMFCRLAAHDFGWQVARTQKPPCRSMQQAASLHGMTGSLVVHTACLREQQGQRQRPGYSLNCCTHHLQALFANMKRMNDG